MIKQMKLPIRRYGLISDRLRFLKFSRYKKYIEDMMDKINKNPDNQTNMYKLSVILGKLERCNMNPDLVLVGWIARNIECVKLVHTMEYFDFGIIIATSYDRIVIPDIGRIELLYDDMRLIDLYDSNRESQLNWIKKYCSFVPLLIAEPEEEFVI